MNAMTVELKIRFPIDDAELSALHHRAFSPDQPEPGAATRPWADRLERHSLTWVGAFSAGRLVGFVHAVWDGGTHAFILDTMVDPGFQRLGIGRDLVAAVTDESFKGRRRLGARRLRTRVRHLLRARLRLPTHPGRPPLRRSGGRKLRAVA